MTLADKIYLRLPSLIVSLPLLLIVFIPRPPMGGSQFIIFPVIALASILIILNPTDIKSDFIDLRKSGAILFILILQAFMVVFSQFINTSSIRFSGAITIFRPFLLLIIVLLGIYISKRVSLKNLYKGLYITGVVIILGQFIISITQALNFPIFDLLYSAEKARGFGRIFRVTGSLSNPNIFGFIIIQAAVLVLLFSKKKTKYLWFGLATILILASGSRSQLLIFPFAVVLAVILARPKINFKFLIKSFVTVTGGLGILLLVIYIYSDTFRYMSQLFILLDGTDLTAISSLSARYEMWAAGWTSFLADNSWHKWWVGLGSRPQFSVGDNDFFYVIWHYGLLGLFIHIMLYSSLFIAAWGCQDSKVKALAICTLTLLFLLGFQSETLGAWLQPLSILYFIGLSLGIKNQIRRPLKKI